METTTEPPAHYLPVEILEHIICYIDDRKVLKSLLFSSKYFWKFARAKLWKNPKLKYYIGSSDKKTVQQQHTLASLHSIFYYP